MRPQKAILLGAAVTAALPIQSLLAKSDKQPNIIYIIVDDLGYGELGCYGQEKIETPNIDKLAKSGMIFTNHYSGTAVSGPSRCILMTGQHSGHAYIRGNDEMGSRGDVWSHKAMLENSYLEGQMPLKANTQTIARQLQGAGYKTACVGKWGLGYPGSEGEPNKQGFDFFYGYNCQRQAHTYYPPFLYKNEKRVYLDNPLLPPGTKLDKGVDPRAPKSYDKYTLKQYSPDLMFDEVMGFVGENKENPFLLMWTTPIPHVALQAPQKWVDYYVNKFGDEEPYIGNKGYFPCRYPRATYAAMITYFDDQVGKLVEKLKQEGIYDNTIIMFTSDNGPTFNGGSDSPWFDSAKPFKSEVGWGKASIREGGIRVPFIVSWPSKVKAGTKNDHICAFWDMLPTMCEVAKADYNKSIVDGISIVPALLGKKQKKHDYLYWEYPEGRGSLAIRMGKWKGFIPKIKDGNRTMELYDLEKDPREQNNLADQYPKVVETLTAKMKEAHQDPENKRFDMGI